MSRIPEVRMIPPATAREALFTETLGDMAVLVDRLEVLLPSLQDARQALIDANQQLSGQLRAFEGRMTAITENAKTVVVDHVARRTNEIAYQSKMDQTQAMKEAALALFNTQFADTLNGLVSSLRPLIERLDRPWEPWFTHAATAAVSSVSTAVVVWLLRHP